jgi:hypothetical protein
MCAIELKDLMDFAAFESHTEFAGFIAGNSDAIARLLLDNCSCA